MRDERLLGAPFREIRAVRERDDGPWPGVLVRLASGTACVRVDAGVLGADWRGWEAPPVGHVLAPIDLARTPTGHDVLLPVCAERLEDFVRRRSARSAFLPGEAVTLGVSVLRGCAQLTETPDVTGEWWLDDSGRPVLATDVSPQRALDAAAAALTAAAIDPRMGRAWRAAIEAVSATRVTAREIADAEELLFGAADPEPLATINLAPRRAVDVASEALVPETPAADASPRPLWQTLVGSVDADLADTVSRATTAVWRRMRTPTRSRRAPWLVGGAVAAAVLAGGALWPAAGGVASIDGAAEATPGSSVTGTQAADPSAADPSAADAPAADPAVAPTAVPSEPVAEDGDLATVVAGLLDARAACEADAGCLGGVVADPAVPFAAGVIDRPAADRTLTLLDDFGDIAVLRVDANDGTVPAQLVVVIHRDEKWLLRDVHDVAQQP